MQYYAEKKEKLGQSKSNAVTIKNVLLHLIKYKGDKITMAQVDKAYCEGFVMYLAMVRLLVLVSQKEVVNIKRNLLLTAQPDFISIPL